MAIISVFDGTMARIGREGQNPFPTDEKSAEILKGKNDCRVARCNSAEAVIWRVERKTDACTVVFGNAHSAEALNPSREEKDACACRVVFCFSTSAP